MKKVYTAVATADGRHNARATSSDGVLDVPITVPEEMGGEGGGTNPEQLFAAGYAACFASAIQTAAAMRDQSEAVRDSSVTAHVDLGKGKTGLELAVQLHVDLPHMGGEEADALVQRAHQGCPYSRATRGNVDVELVVSSAKAGAGS
jgi:osmotically inducible protein OsmC